MIKGLIAIRSGSKGLRDKNILTLGNIPLYHWALFSALKSEIIDEILISSDSNYYLNLSKEIAKTKLLLRDKNISLDKTKIAEVVLNLIKGKHLENTKILVLIQAPQPFVKPETISKAVKLLVKTNCDTVITALKHESSHPSWSFELEKQNKVKWLDPLLCEEPRQKLPLFYKRAGSVYVINLNKFKINKNIYGPDVRAIEVDDIEAISIDNSFDFKLCEAVINIHNLKSFF